MFRLQIKELDIMLNCIYINLIVLCELKFCCCVIEIIEIRKMRVETINILVKIFN